MAEVTVHEILPLEIFEKVLKKLGYKSLKSSRGTCKQWRKVIDDLKLVKYASCKGREDFKSMTFLLSH